MQAALVVSGETVEILKNMSSFSETVTAKIMPFTSMHMRPYMQTAALPVTAPLPWVNPPMATAS